MNKGMLINIIVCFVIIFLVIAVIVTSNKNEETSKPIKSIGSKVIEEIVYPKFTYSKDWDADESYLLAKIAMAEAESCSTQTKCLVIMTVLNRVWNNKFPNTIEEVIYQKTKDTYEFSPIGDGRWYNVEPDEDCWKALDMVMKSEYDFSKGALYFECCENKDNWHSRNLQFLYESDGVRFYK